METADEQEQDPERARQRGGEVVAMREAGASWLDIQRAFDLTRQQARYAYQIGKRAERRARRRSE